MKVTPLNQFRELQILWLFPARSSDTGTAGTGIEILGSCSARPLFYTQHHSVHRHRQYVDNHNKQLWQQIHEYIWHTHTPSSSYIHFVLFFSQDHINSIPPFWTLNFPKENITASKGRFVLSFTMMIFIFHRTQVRSLPCLVSPWVTRRPCWILFKLLDFQSCYMYISALLHGFVKIDTWIFPSCYFDFSKLIHTFL